MDKQLITRTAKKDDLRAMVNANCCKLIDEPTQPRTQRKQVRNYAVSNLGSNDDAYQQAVYNPPNYKDLSSASNALEKAIGNFFVSSNEKRDDE